MLGQENNITFIAVLVKLFGSKQMKKFGLIFRKVLRKKEIMDIFNQVIMWQACNKKGK